MKNVFSLLPIALAVTSSISSGQSSVEKPQKTPSVSEQLPEMEVTADAARAAYTAAESPSLLKLPVPLLETPQTVTVVPKEVFRDQAAKNLKDVYRNVSGVFESGNTLNAQSEVLPVIRGFEAPFVFRNGMRATEVGTVDLFNIESAEVIKGPASILFGGLEPGGVLNYTTKRPLAERFNEIVQEVGSWNHFRTTLDSTGPLDSKGRVLYRLNMAYTNSESFRNDMDLERFAIAPSLLWKISEDTEIGLDVSYTKEKTPYDSGVPLGFDNEPLVPVDTFFGDPDLEGRTLEDTFVGVDLKHRLNEIFSVRSRLQFHRAEPKNESLRNRGLTGTSGNEILRQRYQNEARVDDEIQWVTDFTAEFTTGLVKHDALVGLDVIHQDSEFDRFRMNKANVPVSSDPDVNFDPPADSDPVPDIKSQLDWTAFYFQDQMSMLKDQRLHLLVGARYDDVKQDQSRPVKEESDDGALTLRGGVLYEATSWMSPYVSVSESFRPQLTDSIDKSGNVLDPTEGIQYEAGVKLDFFDQRLVTTLSAYQIEKDNVAVFDNQYYTDTGLSTYYPGVKQRSRGIELDIAGRITDELSIIANYAYTDTEVLENPEALETEGDRLGGVPLQALRVWLAYDFPEESKLNGLGFGAGARFESERTAQFADDVKLDEFVVFDAGIWYSDELASGHVWRARLNFQNLTDEEYYPRASTRDIAHPGSPFGVIASVGIEF
jgi:iron complex outermembrane recepter protein